MSNPFQDMRDRTEDKVSPVLLTRLAHIAAGSMNGWRFVRACIAIDKLDRTAALRALADSYEITACQDFAQLRLYAHDYLVRHAVYSAVPSRPQRVNE